MSFIFEPSREKTNNFYICENKDADQLCSNCTADQRLCFRHKDTTIPLLLMSKFSRFLLYAVTVHSGLCRTCSESQIVGFLMHRFIYNGKFVSPL